MAQLVSTTQISFLSSTEGNARISQITASFLAEAKGDGVFVSTAQISFLAEHKDSPPRVSQITLGLLISNDQTIDPTLVVNDSTQEVFGPLLNRVVSPVQGEIAERELNPYRPEVPVEYREISGVFYDFTKEQVETLRQQHMLIQAGDSTFGWEVLTKLNKERFYTLGAIGRFYHDDYGIVLARYVRFVDMVQTPWIGAPVGRLNTSTKVLWEVTNNFEKSGRDLVAGVLGSFTIPANGEYGWIIIGGPNIQSLSIADIGPPATESELVWTATGESRTGVDGKVFARVWHTQPTVSHDAGSVWINLEGKSLAGIQALFDDDFDSIDGQLASITNRLDLLESSSLGADLTALTAIVNSIRLDLTSETAARIYNDQQLRQRIIALESAIVNNCCDALKLYVDEQNAIQDAEVAGIATLVSGLQTTIAGYMSVTDIRIAALETEVDALTDRVSVLESRPGAGLPLVTGEAGPVFVVDDWNQLIFVEI